MKCMYGSHAAAACVGCQRRGIKCVSQEFPEEISTPLDKSRQMSDRMLRVEALVEQLVRKVGSDGITAGEGTTVSSHSEYSRFVASSNPLQVGIPDPRAQARSVG